MIRKLKPSDINGLNSLPPPDWAFDYEYFLQDYLHEDYFAAFVMTQAGRAIGTGNVFLKEGIGWLANIIIAENHRGKGLGFKMTQFLVDFLNSKGCKTQLLIATELGEPVYRKLGFKKVSDYQSFATATGYDYNPPNFIRGLTYSDLQQLRNLDRTANGENRTHFIDKYYKTGLGYFNNHNELVGCYLPDFGRGLVLASEEAAGIALLKVKHAQKGRRTMLPLDNQAGIDFFEKSGLQKGHTSARMILGKEVSWNPRHIYSYGSGYAG